jgi:hypothetical protein
MFESASVNWSRNSSIYCLNSSWSCYAAFLPSDSGTMSFFSESFFEDT